MEQVVAVEPSGVVLSLEGGLPDPHDLVHQLGSGGRGGGGPLGRAAQPHCLHFNLKQVKKWNQTAFTKAWKKDQPHCLTSLNYTLVGFSKASFLNWTQRR